MPPDAPSPDSLQAGGNQLRGRTVLVTRAAQQCESLREQLEKRGAKVIVHPAIEIKPPVDDDLDKFDASLKQLTQQAQQNQDGRFDWIVLVSGNGVTHLDLRMRQLGYSHEALKSLNQYSIAAIGTSTLTQLQSLGIDNVCSPEISNSGSLAKLIIARATNQRVLVIRADRGSDELGNKLQAAGINFEEVVAYRSVDVKTADPKVLQMMAEGTIDWVTMTSSAIATSTINLFGAAINRSNGKVKTVSISPRTSQTMRELGFEPSAEAREFNMVGIIAAMQNPD